MQTIAYLSQKGGAGKTTLSVHSAVVAAKAGERVVVIDTDPQRSATTWATARNLPSPQVATVDADRLKDVLVAARHDATTLCIVDCAPHAGPEAAVIARSVDLVLIPVRPSAFDLAAAAQTVEIVSKAGTPGAFVLSACPFRSPEIAEARDVLAGYGLPVAPVIITERRPFARAVATGQAVTEFDPDGKAAQEIADLWRWIRATLGPALQEHVVPNYGVDIEKLTSMIESGQLT